MVFSDEQIRLLLQLEFSNHDISHLSSLDKVALNAELSRQKRKTAFKYHPDRAKNDPTLYQKYLDVYDAYNKLVSMDGIKSSIFDWVKPYEGDIPIDCLDGRMQEQIDDYFDTLQDKFVSLSSEEAKQAFVSQHLSILQLADWLNKNRSKINNNRVEALREATESPSLWNSIYTDWNQLIVKHFGEENLDDATYREAIMLGYYSHILALRKLMSPLKWLSFLTCSLYNLVAITYSHYLSIAFLNVNRDMNIFNLVALVGMLAIPYILIPGSYLMLLYSLPLITRVLYCLANPINQIIRPLSQYFNLSTIYTGIAVALLGAMGSAAFLMLALSAPAITTLATLSLVLDILDWFAMFALIKKLHDEISPDLAYMLGGISVASIILGLFASVDSTLPIETLAEALLLLTQSVSNLGLDVLLYISLSKFREKQSELYTALPHPKQQAPEEIKQAINDVATKKHWSHKLFNTPVDAEEQSKPKTSPLRENGLFGQHQTNDQSSDTRLLLTC